MTNWASLSDLAKFSTTWSVAGLSAAAELLLQTLLTVIELTQKYYRTPAFPLEFRCCLSYCSSRDISISGLGGHIPISGCRSLSRSFEDIFFELAMVENLHFVTWIRLILFCSVLSCCFIMLVNTSVKFRHLKNPYTCLTSCLATFGAPRHWRDVAFCTHSISRKSQRNSLAQCWTDFKKWFYPQPPPYLPPPHPPTLHVCRRDVVRRSCDVLLIPDSSSSRCVVMLAGR